RRRDRSTSKWWCASSTRATPRGRDCTRRRQGPTAAGLPTHRRDGADKPVCRRAAGCPVRDGWYPGVPRVAASSTTSGVLRPSSGTTPERASGALALLWVPRQQPHLRHRAHVLAHGLRLFLRITFPDRLHDRPVLLPRLVRPFRLTQRLVAALGDLHRDRPHELRQQPAACGRRDRRVEP